MDYTEILVSTEQEVGILTLNSPHTANALSKNMIREVIEALQGLDADPSVRVIIIRANGKHFCSGHNLSEMQGVGMVELKFIFEQCSRMMTLVHDIPKPVIAQVHGVATAAGCQLVATCDLAVAEEKARFATPGVKVGLFCTTPMIALSRAVGRKRALEMLFTGRMISAEEAERWGLVNKVVPQAELEHTAMELAHNIATASPLVIAIGKQAFYATVEQDERRAYHLASTTMTANLMTEDAQEGIQAFMAKRTPNWKGR
ncbi:MAG: enoyl-CoA hydratase [Thermodesulfobacteriota bacterium]